MRYLLVLAAGLFALPCDAQHVTESALSLQRKFTPLWGKTSAVMTMTLRNDFEIGGSDSVYSFLVTVTETEMEVQSVSIGFSSFSAGKLLGFGGSGGATSSVSKQDGSVRMDKVGYMSFYKCINGVYKATGALSATSKKKNTLCSCEVDGVEFGGEYLPDKQAGSDQKFYFRLGEAVFTMSKLDFEEIVKFVRDVRLVFETKG